MSLIDDIKPLLKEDADISKLEKKINDAIALTPEKVKEWIAQDSNKPTFDSITGKAISSHIEKAKGERVEWEKTKATELLEEAKKTIAKENQKSPDRLEIEKIQKERADEKTELARLKLRTSLSDVVKNDKLVIHNVDPFLTYGEDAEAELRKFAEANAKLIDDDVKKQLVDKFGKGGMGGGGNDGKKKDDDKPIETKEWLEEQFKNPTGIVNQN